MVMLAATKANLLCFVRTFEFGPTVLYGDTVLDENVEVWVDRSIADVLCKNSHTFMRPDRRMLRLNTANIFSSTS